jgi:RNA-directed DNA polymerase
MKRYGYLYDQITSFENLLQAARAAQKQKRYRPSTLQFNYQLEANLLQLQTDLQTQIYQPGPYRTFEIYEPKPRLISAAPYRDRVVHHALCRIIMPLLDRSFIPDTYANRPGKGTHRALKRFTQFTCQYRHILQCDIRRYFPNIDHDILKSLIRRQIKCPRTLWLIDSLIDSGTTLPQQTLPDTINSLTYFPGDDLLSPLRPKGLPIGNLTSQFLANLYLSQFDHYICEILKPSGYLRYVDDFALFSDDRNLLQAARPAIETYLERLRLEIHPIKSQCFATEQGANFLGFRILPTGKSNPRKPNIRLRNSYLRRSRRTLKQYKQAYAQNQKTITQMQQIITAWTAHINQGNTWKIRRRIEATLPTEWLYSHPEQATQNAAVPGTILPRTVDRPTGTPTPPTTATTTSVFESCSVRPPSTLPRQN